MSAHSWIQLHQSAFLLPLGHFQRRSFPLLRKADQSDDSHLSLASRPYHPLHQCLSLSSRCQNLARIMESSLLSLLLDLSIPVARRELTIYPVLWCTHIPLRGRRLPSTPPYTNGHTPRYSPPANGLPSTPRPRLSPGGRPDTGSSDAPSFSMPVPELNGGNGMEGYGRAPDYVPRPPSKTPQENGYGEPPPRTASSLEDMYADAPHAAPESLQPSYRLPDRSRNHSSSGSVPPSLYPASVRA